MWGELVIRGRCNWESVGCWHCESLCCLTVFFQVSEEIQHSLVIICWSPVVVQSPSVFRKSCHVTAGQLIEKKKSAKLYVTCSVKGEGNCAGCVTVVSAAHCTTVCTACRFCFQVYKKASPLTQWHLCSLPIGSVFLSSRPFIQNVLLLSADKAAYIYWHSKAQQPKV